MARGDEILTVGGRTHFAFVDAVDDPSIWQKIDDEVCLGLAKLGSGIPAEGSVSMIPQELFAEGSIHPRMSETMNQIMANMDKQERDTFDKLDPLAKNRYLRFKHGIYFPWSENYLLRAMIGKPGPSNVNPVRKVIPGTTPGGNPQPYAHDGSLFEWTKEARLHFPTLVKLVDRLTFMKTFGLVRILGRDAYHPSYAQRAGSPACWAKLDECVFINPMMRGKMFIWDPKRKDRLPIRDRMFHIDRLNAHGMDADGGWGYYVAVHGLFTDRARAEIYGAAG